MGLNQRELADLIPSPKVNNQYVSNWERGVRPSDEHLTMLAEALQVDLGYFMEADAREEGVSLNERISRLEEQQRQALEEQRAMRALLEGLSERGALTAAQWELFERLAAEFAASNPPRGGGSSNSADEEEAA